MINKFEKMHIEINIERAVFKYNYKITTRTPFMFAYLNLRKKAIFLNNLVCKDIFSRSTYQNKHLTITTFLQTSLFWSFFETPGVAWSYIFTILNT
jgi:hypothetical protein